MDRQREWNLSDWKRLGRAFAAQREAAGYTQVTAADALGVSRSPVQAIERGRQSNGQPFTKVTQTMRAYAQLVGWTPDSPQRILNGEEPTPALPLTPPDDHASTGLPPAIDLELRNGKTLDSAVVHLGQDTDDDTRIIVVLKGADDLNDVELDELWRKWRKTRRRLQALPGESDTPPES